MSTVNSEPGFHRLSKSSKIENENEALDEETLMETTSKTNPKLIVPKAEDEIVALILSSIMGSIVKSWQYLDEDAARDTSCKLVESTNCSQATNISLIYEKSINSELSYWAMSDSRKRHSLQWPIDSIDSIHNGIFSDAKERLGVDLKSLFGDLKGKIFGWQFIEEEPEVVIVFKQGNRFEGKLSQCRMNGQGKFVWADGSVYEGDFVLGEMTGEGRLQWPDQSRYEGQLRRGHRHGIGLFVQSPTFYAGDWRCGLRHGRGSMFYDQLHTDRGFYNGEWRADRKHGTGLRSYASGARYRGQWRAGKRHGLGNMVWTNHDVYSGNWSDGLIDGYGEYTWDTFINRQLAAGQENCYYGDWRKGVRNGNATLETTSGVIIHGTWKDGKKHGPAEVICNNGTFVYANDLFDNDCISTSPESSAESDSLMDTTATATHSPQRYCVPVNSANHQIELKVYMDRLHDHIVDCKSKRKVFERDVIISSYTGNYNNFKKAIDLNRCSGTQTITDIDVNHEEVHLHNTICQYLSTLKIIYNKYSDICCKVKQTFPSVLMRLFLWQFFRDCNLHTKGRSLADFDVLIANNKASLVQGVHYPFERIQFWQFLHCLLEVAWELYGRDGKGTPTVRGVFASALHKLLTSDVLPNVGLHKGDALFKQKDLLSLDAVYWYYRGLGEPHSARKFLKYIFENKENDSPKHIIPDYPTHLLRGHNIIGVGGKVTYCPDDEPLISELRRGSEQAPHQDLTCLSAIGVVAVFNCLLDVCPSIADDGVIVNMDYKVVYLEFLELLLLCAKLNVIKCISDAKKEESLDKMSMGESGSLFSRKTSPSNDVIELSHRRVESISNKKKTSEEIKPKKGKKSQKKKKT